MVVVVVVGVAAAAAAAAGTTARVLVLERHLPRASSRPERAADDDSVRIGPQKTS